ncbi:large T antigen [Scorpion polyomavirus 3]|nr:large T antigen [Scorpion polyomavirus 3]QTH80113.1 large T antigen [Scorpion polyomavirus 3]
MAESQDWANILKKFLHIDVRTSDPKIVARLYRKKSRQFHPDKGGSEEDSKLLNAAFTQYKESQQSQDSGFNLFCDEDFDDWFSESQGETPPKKEIKIPDIYLTFCRSKNNRTPGKTFMLFSLYHKSSKVEYFLKQNVSRYISAYGYIFNGEYCVCLIHFADISYTSARLNTVFRNMIDADNSPTLVLHSVMHKKLLEEALPEDTFYKYERETPKDSPKKDRFNVKKLIDFALQHSLTDYMELMHQYAHLAETCTIKNYTKEHEGDHFEHGVNAGKFLYLDRKKYARQAVEVVEAEMHASHLRMTNQEFLDEKLSRTIQELYDLDNDINVFFEAISFAKLYGEDSLKDIISGIIDAVCVARPKRRYVCLTGYYNCGKSMLAHAFSQLFDAVSINVNIDRSRLAFQLGNALDRRMVIFDDVRGGKGGYGWENLESLRDHIDGRIEVPLEKKNRQAVQQVFPPGIITTNYLKMSTAMKKRIKNYVMWNIKNFEEHEIFSGYFGKYHLVALISYFRLMPIPEELNPWFLQTCFAANTRFSRHTKNCEVCKNKENIEPTTSTM